MHFEPRVEGFQVLQLPVPHDALSEILRWVIAHELGHVMRGGNWREGDGESIEDDATAQAARWRFVKTPEVRYRQRFAQRI